MQAAFPVKEPVCISANPRQTCYLRLNNLNAIFPRDILRLLAAYKYVLWDIKGSMDSRIASETRPRVLIADDERVIADTLGLILNQSGFEAATAYNGSKAVELARSFHPDVFLGDVVMPGMSGIEAAIQICSMIPECRVLLLSGQAATSDLLRDARVRGHDFEILLKPIHPTQLLARLRAA
jgi:CheY-like chemotaxis protein